MFAFVCSLRPAGGTGLVKDGASGKELGFSSPTYEFRLGEWVRYNNARTKKTSPNLGQSK